MVLSILTKQLDIEKENCLHKEEEQLLLGRKMAKKVCLFGTKDIFVPVPLINGYYDHEYSMIVLNQAKPKKEKLRDLSKAISKAMIWEKSRYHLTLPKMMIDEVTLCLDYFLSYLLGIVKKKLVASTESILIAFGILKSYQI